MPYCPSCGVEISPEATSCPLCGTPNSLASPSAGTGAGQPGVRGPAAVPSASPGSSAQSVPAAVPSASPESPASPARPATRATPASTASSAPASGAHFTGFERKKIVWEVISVACVVAFVTLAAINLLLSGRLSWALYPLASLALVWLLSSAVLLMHHRPVPGILLAVISPPLFLVAIDAIDGPLLWSYELAVPIALLVEIVVAAFAIAVRRARRKGINLIAFALIGASAICLGIEGGLDLYVDARISLGWSAITALSLVPIAVFLLYLHHRVVRTANLRRLFRL